VACHRWAALRAARRSGGRSRAPGGNALTPPRRVAFVIPAHNESSFIAASITSVIGQTLPAAELELLVVENGSTDATAAVARETIAKAPKPFLGRVISLATPGIARAKNTGAHAATGEVLVFLDADSRAAPELAERVLAWVRRGYRAGSIRMIADSPSSFDRRFFQLMDWGKRLFGIHANMLFCERQLFLAAGGFDESIRLAEDLDFLLRIERGGVRLCHVNDATIATSARRLHQGRFGLGVAAMFGRWLLAQLGIGRRWRY
jgi:glycosyltransferase involved in cell wall biosynthesis